MVDLSGKRVLLGVGGGIAAFKVAQLASRLAQAGCELRVAMTASALNFVGESTFAALSGHPVVTDSFSPATYPLGAHIELTEAIDLFIVAPATADLLGKMACGIADTLVTTMYLQNTAPVLVAPAMSGAMWDKPAVQRNVAQLRADGVHLVGPNVGWLSCRKQGAGRMAEPDEILLAASGLLTHLAH